MFQFTSVIGFHEFDYSLTYLLSGYNVLKACFLQSFMELISFYIELSPTRIYGYQR